jgi:hypothetical protein
VHKDSAFYDLAGFKAGANVLTDADLAILLSKFGTKVLAGVMINWKKEVNK